MHHLKFSALFLGPLLILLTVDAARSANKTDLCAGLMPQDVTRLVRARFPHARLPQSYDWTKENIDYNVKSGGTGCLGIASGDFDGDKQQDFAFLLVSMKGKGGILLMAARHQEGNRWFVEELRNWDSPLLGSLYVETKRSGHYERSESLDAPASEPGELERFDSKFTGVVSGSIESSGVAYFFDDKKWVHVWISD